MRKNLTLPIHHLLLDHMDKGLLFVHKEGKIIKANTKAHLLLKIDDSVSEDVTDYLEIEWMDEIPFHQSKICYPKKNSKQPLEVKAIQVNQEILCILIHKINLKNSFKQLKKKQNLLFHEVSEGYFMFHKDYIVDCDPKTARMFGYETAEIKGKKIGNLILDQGKLPWTPNNSKQVKRYDLFGVNKKGLIFPIELWSFSYDVDHEKLSIGMVKDISERLKQEKQLRYMAYYDELTNLPNRHYFTTVLNDALKEAKETNESIAVYFVDIDYFKEINETLGYEVSDKLLLTSSERLRNFQTESTFISRVGGDEFLILQRSISDQHKSEELAKKIISAFEEPVLIEGYEVYTSVSIGISVYPDNGMTAGDLMKHAVSAMYVIKEKHQNHYNFFKSSISEKFKMLVTMENDLRKSLKNNELELFYQPQISLQTNKIVGIEALLRWNHPEKGYIPPNDFIPLAEKTDLIIEIGEWVLREACYQNKKWLESGLEPLIVSVNLSAKQFHQRNLVEKIEEILRETKLEPQYLALEITESMAVSNEQYIIKTLRELQELGVHVSIDDFGTGYSSFKYLSKFPITKLKIDKMFMDEKQRQNKAIVKSIISMSHSLGLKVIAEGVETYDQLNFLKRQNCDEFQGFLYSKPLPPQKIISVLENEHQIL